MASRITSRVVRCCRSFSNNFPISARRFLTSKAGNYSSRTVPLLFAATVGVGSVVGGIYAAKNIKYAGITSYMPFVPSVHAAKKQVSHGERTFIMIKPDGVHRALVGDIIKRFEQKGFKLVAMKFLQPNKELLNKHYEDLSNKPFFPGLIKYMTSGPVLAMVWEGEGVVKTGRVMLGETHPAKSLPGTIRGDYCIQVGRNIVHGSDSVESAKTEIGLWFKESELVDWTPELDRWINEN